MLFSQYWIFHLRDMRDILESLSPVACCIVWSHGIKHEFAQMGRLVNCGMYGELVLF